MVRERRREVRSPLEVSVLIWGIDAEGEAFRQPALAGTVSGNGALITGIEPPLRCGDFIGVQYRNSWAKYEIVWVRDSKSAQKTQAAVQIAKGQECPWRELLVRAVRATDAELQTPTMGIVPEA